MSIGLVTQLVGVSEKLQDDAGIRQDLANPDKGAKSIAIKLSDGSISTVEEALNMGSPVNLDNILMPKVTVVNPVGSNVSLDLEPKNQVSMFDVTLNLPITTLAFINATVMDGRSRSVTITLRQGTGANKVRWPANVVWPYSREPVLTFTTGSYDRITLIYDPVSKVWGGVVDGGWINGR